VSVKQKAAIEARWNCRNSEINTRYLPTHIKYAFFYFLAHTFKST
jgi:hypothetical protein